MKDAEVLALVALELRAMSAALEPLAMSSRVQPQFEIHPCLQNFAEGVSDDLIEVAIQAFTKLPQRVQTLIECVVSSRSETGAAEYSMQAKFNAAYIVCATKFMACVATKKGWDRLDCLLYALGCLATALEADQGGGNVASPPPRSGYVAPTKARQGCQGQ
jgi:hypothetical protein